MNSTETRYSMPFIKSIFLHLSQSSEFLQYFSALLCHQSTFNSEETFVRNPLNLKPLYMETCHRQRSCSAICRYKDRTEKRRIIEALHSYLHCLCDWHGKLLLFSKKIFQFLQDHLRGCHIWEPDDRFVSEELSNIKLLGVLVGKIERKYNIHCSFSHNW